MKVLTPETWDMMLAVNLTGVFLCSRAAVPLLRAAGGGSVVGLTFDATTAWPASWVAMVAGRASSSVATEIVARSARMRMTHERRDPLSPRNRQRG